MIELLIYGAVLFALWVIVQAFIDERVHQNGARYHMPANSAVLKHRADLKRKARL